MIFYFCPDLTLQSAGLRILYRHVEILSSHGHEAAILHTAEGFRVPDMPDAPVRYLSTGVPATGADVVVIPEIRPNVMDSYSKVPFRRFAIALNWGNVYATLPDHLDWRDFRVERILTHSAFIADYLAWAMRLPTHVFAWAVKDDLYHPTADKRPQVVYIARKKGKVDELKRVLRSRNPAFVREIEWKSLDGLTETAYAHEVRASQVFLNLSDAEGLPCSLLEAMRAHTLVCGYNSVGGQRELIAAGPRQNCILAENLDYPTLAWKIEPLLSDIVKGDLSSWEAIRQNAYQTSAAYTPAAEAESVLSMWRSIL